MVSAARELISYKRLLHVCKIFASVFHIACTLALASSASVCHEIATYGRDQKKLT